MPEDLGDATSDVLLSGAGEQQAAVVWGPRIHGLAGLAGSQDVKGVPVRSRAPLLAPSRFPSQCAHRSALSWPHRVPRVSGF